MQTPCLEQIKKGLNSPLNICLLKTVTSTMDYIKSNGDIFAVIANSQTNGRGTKNRNFISSEGGIYLSAVIKPNISTDKLPLVTPYFATVIGNALKEFNIPYSYKWVNDVFVSNKKLAGILTETSISNGKVDKIIVGIGLNVNQKTFPNDLTNIATSLALEGFSVDINRLIALLLNGIANFNSAFSTLDFLSEYKANSLVINKKVSVTFGNNVTLGTVIDIGGLGELLIKTDTGVVKVHGGDLTLL